MSSTPIQTQLQTELANTSFFSIERLREDFPLLHQKVRGFPLVYLDNAATAQKPRQVIEALNRYYREDNANIHRGVHLLSERATEQYEAARIKIQKFLNAAHAREILFCRGTTEAINLVAQSLGRSSWKRGDEVVISHMEHHSNIVPWQLLRDQIGIELKVIPISDAGELDLESFEKLLSEKTKLVSIVHVSNALGTLNPVETLIRKAHDRGIPVLLDGAQAIPHLRADVQSLDVDFYAFSGHKLFGPTGIGVLYGKEKLLDAMAPYQGGGDMIRQVTFEKTTYNSLPYKFEAGTPHIAGAIGLGAAIDYLQSLNWTQIESHEHDLLQYGTEALSQIPGLKIIGQATQKVSVISFIMEEIHPHDLGTLLDARGIAIRTGLPATARASMSFYNTREEIDALVTALHKAKEVFA